MKKKLRKQSKVDRGTAEALNSSQRGAKVGKRRNKVKPTPKQKEAFKHIKRGLKLKDAMLEAGYTKQTAHNTRHNLIESPGFQVLINKYKKDLMKAGISTEVLAEVQAEGLFDQNPNTRLDYLKETKKDFGLTQEKSSQNQAQQTNVYIEAQKNADKFIVKDGEEVK